MRNLNVISLNNFVGAYYGKYGMFLTQSPSFTLIS